MRSNFVALLLACTSWAQPSLLSQVRIGPIQLVELGAKAGQTGTSSLTSSDRIEVLRKISEAAKRGPEALLPPAGADPRVIFDIWADQWSDDLRTGLRLDVTLSVVRPGVVEIQRSIRDGFRQQYVRYSVTIETIPDSGGYRLTLGDSKVEDQTIPASWKSLSPTQYPAAQLVREGESVALRFSTDAEADNALTDYIHVGHQDHIKLRSLGTKEAYTEDALLVITEPHLRLDGVTVDASAAEEVKGRVLSLTIPGLGTYHLSAKPRPGLKKFGEVSGGRLILGEGGHILTIDSAERIADFGSGTYNIYGTVDPEVRPQSTVGAKSVFAVLES